jgi:Sulfatase
LNPAQPKFTWLDAAKGAAALLVLNSLLSFGPWWPTPGIVFQARLAPELVALWLLLLRLVARDRILSRRALWVLTAFVFLLIVGRYADVTAPSLFGRPVNLYWDLPQLPRFLWVSAKDHPIWISATVAAIAVGAIWVLLSAVRLCLATVARTLAPWTLRTFSAWVASFVAALLAAAHLAWVPGTGRWVSNAVLPTYLAQVRLLWDAHAPGSLADALPAITPTEDALAAHGAQVFATLAGRDVVIVFLESFGAVLYDHPEVRAATDPARRVLQETIAASGRHVVSGFFESPTIGGASDLAHLSLLSGVDLSEARRHDLLLTTRRPTLLHLFKQAGYETFGVYHAVSWPWPEHVYYGFDRYIDASALRYEGPPITFWKIPDQVALARYEQLYPRTPQSPPRVLFFPTISSHFPFSPAPPYQPDWQRVVTDSPFDPDALKAVASVRVNWLNMRADYIATIAYVYQWLNGYFRLPEPRETVYVLIGDHQPTANITGERPPWDVPVHIISRDRALLDRFKAQGFSDGLWPDRKVLGGLHNLTSLLLSGFGPAPASP